MGFFALKCAYPTLRNTDDSWFRASHPWWNEMGRLVGPTKHSAGHLCEMALWTFGLNGRGTTGADTQIVYYSSNGLSRFQQMCSREWIRFAKPLKRLRANTAWKSKSCLPTERPIVQ